MLLFATQAWSDGNLSRNNNSASHSRGTYTFNGVFGRFDLAALRGCRTLSVCFFV
jgi:hypothetical protein